MYSQAEDISEIRRIFEMRQLPANVKLSQALERVPVIRRLHSINQWAVGTSLVRHDGAFIYRRDNSAREIRFNGRNLQFHALYGRFYRNGYELETSLLLRRLCSGNGAFFDIGANWGYFSLLLAATPPFTGPIFAFEPNPRTFEDLSSVVNQAGLAGRVQPCRFGLGRNQCEMTVVEPDAFLSGLSRLSAHGGGTRIAVKRLDDLNLPAPVFLKIDAEGMEADILLGSLRLLNAGRPFVLVESFLDHINPERTYASLDLLAGQDYQIFVPALIFERHNYRVPATYGSDFGTLLDEDPAPGLGLFEATRENRFLLGSHLNLLAVHKDRLDEVWDAGLMKMSPIN